MTRKLVFIGIYASMDDAESVAATIRSDHRGTCIYAPQDDGGAYEVWATRVEDK